MQTWTRFEPLDLVLPGISIFKTEDLQQLSAPVAVSLNYTEVGLQAGQVMYWIF
jgi:hypothetical protein